MSTSTTAPAPIERPARGKRLDIKLLVGSGERIGALVLPFLVIGVIANVLRPEWFGVGGPPPALATLSAVMLVPGVVIWLWSAALILTKVPRGELITTGPFSLVKHPLYTGVGLLVLPWVGFLLNTWLGAVLGILVYMGSRRFAPEEEHALAKEFGAKWDAYARSVKAPWL